VLLGCAIEGAMLLVLFASAHFVETRLTGHARGDLRMLWATVPGEATIVELAEDGSPDASSERLVPARDVAVGANVFVRAGQQVSEKSRVFFRFFFPSFSVVAPPPRRRRRVREDDFRRNFPRRD